MKRCPSCNRTYTDVSLNFCLEDGTPLVGDAPGVIDPHATIRDSPARVTNEPPPTEIYRQKPLLNQVAGMAQPRPAAPQWSSMPATQPRKKSNAIWWVLGIVAVLAVIGTGLVVMLLALASMGTNGNVANTNTNTSSPVVTRNKNANANANTASETNTNTNADTELPTSITDDFSGQKWRTGNFQYGDIWYDNEQYHMRSKEKTYLVMYAPSAEYGTENASVRVTARALDASPTSGYGLIVHGEKSTDNQLEDYALLVYTGSEPQYEVVMHKGGSQTTLVPWTKTAVLRSGTNPNQLEIRTKGDELSFYINGRFLTRITDKENFKRGVAGLYTSESPEVVFDDLEIRR